MVCAGGHILERHNPGAGAPRRALVPERGGPARAPRGLPRQHGRLQPALPGRAAAVPARRAPAQEGAALRR